MGGGHDRGVKKGGWGVGGGVGDGCMGGMIDEMTFFLPWRPKGAHRASGDLAAECQRRLQRRLVRVEAEVANHDPIVRLHG